MQKYAELYNKYQEGGFTKEESEELTSRYEGIIKDYYKKINSGTVEISSLDINQQRAGSLISNLEKLNEYLATIPDTPTLDKMSRDLAYMSNIDPSSVLEINSIIPRLKQTAKDIAEFVKNNPSTSYSFYSDPNTNLYIFKAGDKQLVLDPKSGRYGGYILPILQQGIYASNQGNFELTMDYLNGPRFKNYNTDVLFQGSTYHRLRGVLKAKPEIKAAATAQIIIDAINWAGKL
jgi:hypothetical protein